MTRRMSAMFLALVMVSLIMVGCARQPKPDVALMEFPGVKWNSTPEEVIKSLKLTDEQIMENEMKIPNEGEATVYDVWNLTITDWEFMDSKVVGGHFQFVRYPGHDFGLMRVQLYLADDTDMNAVRTKMVEVYGEGTTEPTPNYYFWEGKLESSESTIKRRENGFPHFWYATTKGTEVLTDAATERYVEYAANSDAAVSRDVAIEYLDVVPSVSVTCTTWNLSADLLEKSNTPNPHVTHNTIIFAANQMVHNLQQFEE